VCWSNSLSLSLPDKKQHNPTRFFCKVNSIIFDRFFAADYDSVLEFFPARQDFEIIGLLWRLLQYVKAQILKANIF
jgi:hypothetical protein